MGRKRLEFWLDASKNNEGELIKVIETLKSRRSFISTIRDGIRLIVDLRAGNTTVLFQLFPWLQEKFHTTPTVSISPMVNPHLSVALEAQVKRLEALLMNSKDFGTGDNVVLSVPRKSATPHHEPDDDLGITVTTVRAENSNASQNFLDSMFNL